MILFVLIGTFMMFTGIILDTMSKLINENKKKVILLSNPDKEVELAMKNDPFNNPWNSS